ncbi:hypothetical protein CDAR_609291 [Caerostris darwini]|uniref:Uncharacterized protein n=1 Tax=Caerostris darwini TaxID=1538125 RepID=A0AAV4S7B6_9ARAC|nr:hypothetical protein CDAR_609291 [Caerostris darwini]
MERERFVRSEEYESQLKLTPPDVLRHDVWGIGAACDVDLWFDPSVSLFSRGASGRSHLGRTKVGRGMIPLWAVSFINDMIEVNSRIK